MHVLLIKGSSKKVWETSKTIHPSFSGSVESKTTLSMSELLSTPDVNLRTVRRMGACAARVPAATSSPHGTLEEPSVAAGLLERSTGGMFEDAGSIVGPTMSAPHVHTALSAASQERGGGVGQAMLSAHAEGTPDILQGMSSTALGGSIGSMTHSPAALAQCRAALLCSSQPSREALRAALGPPSRVDEAAWRNDVAQRNANWLCPNCKEVVPKVVSTCTGCGAAYATFCTGATTAEVDAIAEDARESAYGRSLLFIGGAKQVEGEAVAALPGSPAYIQAVFKRISEQGERRSVDERVRTEMKPHQGVVTYDGWLAVQTCDSPVGTARLWTREHVQQFMARDDHEALLCEYVNDHGRTIRTGAHAQLVQAVPKGGWWRCTAQYVVEHDLHVMRAALGLAPTGFSYSTALKLQQAILFGQFDAVTYTRCEAVVKAIWTRMICIERGPSGRLRRPGIAAPSPAFVAVRGVQVPRHLVAFLAKKAMSSDAIDAM